MPPLPDFSVRDDHIRHLTYTPLTRRSGVPQDAFDAYWRDVHGPLCARLPGLGYYVQHHFDAARDANLWPLPDGVAAMTVVLDGMVEIGFASRDDQEMFGNASPLLFKDERNFIGHDVAYALPNGSRTLVDRERDAVPNRPALGHHLHVHFGARSDGIGDAVTALAEALVASDDIVKVRLHLPERYDNADPQPAAPDVDHQLSPDRQHAALLEVAWQDRLAAETFLASDRYAQLAADIAPHCATLGAFRVKGVYTYIRDAVLTTAGLRGSRPAMLIDALGASNQTEMDAATLFTND